jgi:hypothetical protein
LDGFGKKIPPIYSSDVRKGDDLKENEALVYILEYVCGQM